MAEIAGHEGAEGRGDAVEAERQAHSAGEFDEAAAMRRAGGQSAEDLERALQGKIDLAATLGNRFASLPLSVANDVRAALARERALRKALRELLEAEKAWGKHGDTERWNAAIDRAEALLVQPAAGKERERG